MPSRASGVLAKNIDRILDAMPEGVFITDTAGKTLFINSMYETLTGIRRSDVQGRNVRNLVSEGVFDLALNPEIVRTGKPMTHAQKLKNGKQLVLSGFPVFDREGEVQLVVTFVRDVTMLSELGREVDRQRRLIEQIHGQIAHMAQEGLQQAPLFESPAMADVLKRLRKIGPTDATVLILGETGVGKNVYARLTHSLSERRDKIFLKVDSGGISEHLTESELFGSQPGAFTGASLKGKAGYFLTVPKLYQDEKALTVGKGKDVEALNKENVATASAEVTMIPQNYVSVTDPETTKYLQRILETYLLQYIPNFHLYLLLVLNFLLIQKKVIYFSLFV